MRFVFSTRNGISAERSRTGAAMRSNHHVRAIRDIEAGTRDLFEHACIMWRRTLQGERVNSRDPRTLPPDERWAAWTPRQRELFASIRNEMQTRFGYALPPG
jgi:hypothetical protein